MLSAPLVLLNLTFVFVLRAREEFALYNAVRCLNLLLTLLALGLLALTYRLTPFNAALAYLLPTVPISLWMLIRLWRLYRLSWRGLVYQAPELVWRAIVWDRPPGAAVVSARSGAGGGPAEPGCDG